MFQRIDVRRHGGGLRPRRARIPPGLARNRRGHLNRRAFTAANLLRRLVLAWFLAGVCAWATAGSFRFAWLSDTHIGASSAEEDLRTAVQDINSMTGVSFVVVSGDVTEYGSRAQLRLAKEVLDGLSVPCQVIPGNHDTRWSESGTTDFSRLWKQDRFEFEHGGFRFIGMHQGPVMKMGDGHWAPQDVRWLETVLQKMSDTNQPIIFITHYPIDASIANWYRVLDLLKTRNTQAILCGHGHGNRLRVFEGIPGVMGRSSLRAKNPAGGFNVVEIENSRMTFREHVPGTGPGRPWHSLQLQRREYWLDTNQYPRPDFSVNGRYPLVKPRWRFDTGCTVASTPALWRDVVMVGDGSGAIHGLSLQTGKPRWRFKARDAVYSTPACAGQRVIFASADGNVYALDAAEGTELWRFETARPIVASPIVRAGVVYIGSSEGKFRALEAKSGKLLWEFGGLEGFVETRPLLYKGNVIFGAWDQRLYALNARTGKLAWSWKGDRPGTLLSPAACWPVAAHGKVFLVAPDRKMTALDAVTGQQIWRTGDYVVRESVGLSEDASRLYVRAMNDYFYAFATAPNRPAKLWETNAHFGYDINSAMLVEKQGVLFYGTKNGLLLALEGKTGAVLWEHKIGPGSINTVVALSATRVLAADVDGTVVLIEAASRTP